MPRDRDEEEDDDSDDDDDDDADDDDDDDDELRERLRRRPMLRCDAGSGSYRQRQLGCGSSTQAWLIATPRVLVAATTKVLPFNLPEKRTIYAAASRTQRMPLLLDAESGEFLWRAALR